MNMLGDRLAVIVVVLLLLCGLFVVVLVWLKRPSGKKADHSSSVGAVWKGSSGALSVATLKHLMKEGWSCFEAKASNGDLTYINFFGDFAGVAIGRGAVFDVCVTSRDVALSLLNQHDPTLGAEKRVSARLWVSHNWKRLEEDASRVEKGVGLSKARNLLHIPTS